jgi:Nitrate and nitrite sensing
LAAADPATRDAFLAQRTKAQAFRNEGLDHLAASPVPEHTIAEVLAAEDATAARLDAMRSSIDQVLHRVGVTPPSQAAWFAAATAEIEALTKVRRLIEANRAADPAIAQLVVVRDGLAEMAEFAGRERGRVSGAIAADARLTAADMADLGILRGVSGRCLGAHTGRDGHSAASRDGRNRCGRSRGIRRFPPDA